MSTTATATASSAPEHTPAAWRRGRRLLGPWTLAVPLASVYLLLSPQSPDLAAASYRSHLFSTVGFSLWDNSWYGGHHLPAYSLLAPALGALIGPALLAALSTVAAAAAFEAILTAAASLPRRTVRIASLWFAFGASIALLSSRVPFDLGLAIALCAVLSAQRGHTALAGGLALLASAASPVAGAFLAMAMLAWSLAGSDRRTTRLVLCALALAPIVVLSVCFPEGGSQPYVPSAFWPALAGLIVVALAIPAEQRALRIGAALYAAVLIGSFAIPSAVGGNADRLGALATGPVAAVALTASADRRRRLMLLALAAPLTYWQVNAPVTDFVSTVSNPAAHASYYGPLLKELAKLGIGYGRRPARIEVVPTVDHWEARYVAPAVMIARGWERQLDRYRNGLFYDSAALDRNIYRRWLNAQSISYIALPDASLDYSGKAEARIILGPEAENRPLQLREVWHSAHWRLFRIGEPQPLAHPGVKLVQADTQSFTIDAIDAGSYVVRLHFTPYWAVASKGACVARAPGDWTEVRTAAPGLVHVRIDFSLSRVLSNSPRCN